jgi:hypothetical protein
MTPVALPAQSIVTYGSKILIALPWQKSVSPITATCIAQLIDRRRCASSLHFGDAFVAHTRNSIADTFLKSKCEWMLSIDDDMVVPFGDPQWFKFYTGFRFPEKFMGLNALDRLMSHGKSLVGALYFGRSPGAPPVYNEGMQEAAHARGGPHDVCKPTRWVGTGCMLTHRSVFESIEQRFPRLSRAANNGRGQWFTSTEASLLDTVVKARDSLQRDASPAGAFAAMGMLEHAVALSTAENFLGSGEDVSFCLRANAAGHQAHVDMGLICGHLGTFCYGPANVLQ